jgi:phosphate acetyltransferase
MEPQSGKSVVALGMMEMLSARAERVGFFRPVASGERDPETELMRRRFGVETGQALSEDEARADPEEVAKRVVAAYRALAERCDAIVCEGTDFAGAAPALDFDLNARLANEIGAPVLVVVRGGSDPEGAVRAARESLARKGCDVFGLIVSRVPAESAPDLRDLEPPVYVLPEEPELAFPTVGEVTAAVGASPLFEPGDGRQRQVRNVRIAAMSVEHFLADLAEGTLVIVPGDRADILVACVVSTLSAEIPAVAGLLLTAGHEPYPAIRRLLEGAPFPVFETPRRTYAAATAVHAVRPLITTADERKIATAIGLFQSSVDPLELEQRLALERPARMTPVMFEYELLERAREDPQHIVLPEGDDERVLRAADILLRRGVVRLTILGDPEGVRTRAGALGLDLDGARLVDPLSSPLRAGFAERYHELRKHKGVTEELALDTVGDVSYFGTLLVHAGEVDGMVSGAAHTTGDTIRPAFEIIKARPGVSVVSSVFLMCLADRVLVYGDCAVNPTPSVEQLADIAIGSAETGWSFGIEPRIAMLSYSTGESGRGEAVDAVREAAALVRERRPDLKVEGPIQYDAAVEASVARLKLPGSEVAGQATVFVFPDLNTGNIAYKAVQRSAGAVAIGPVLQGLRKPVNDLSRGCTVTDIVNTVVITAIQAQEASGRSTSRLRVELPAS